MSRTVRQKPSARHSRDNPGVRVLHLTDRLTDRGGAHRHLLAVARAQAARGDDVQSRPPWYQRTCIWWIVSANKEETRRRRLATLMEVSAKGLPIHELDRRPPQKAR
jgi:bacteriocin resistance YdeI/OmpD-like protein